jgi:hypothetical protein
MPQSEKLF